MIESVRLFKQPPPEPGCELKEAKVMTDLCFYINIRTYIRMYHVHTVMCYELVHCVQIDSSMKLITLVLILYMYMYMYV